MRRSDLLSRLLAVAMLAQFPLAHSQDGPDFKVELDPETCVFTGGSDGAGNVDVVANTGNRRIQVRLTNHSDYSIDSVSFDGPGQDQMEATGGDQSHVTNIFNRNSGPADVKYSVIVRHRETGETRDCDPRIINR